MAGLRCGRVIERPEELLAGVDLVFAKARTALEAMAVGCAVVLSDIFGCGPLVTLREFEQMRSCNFGIRLLREPHSVDWYRSQIAAYDAAEAARVSSRVRQDAGLDDAVDRLLEIYERAIADGKNLPSRQAADIEGSSGPPRATSPRSQGDSSRRLDSSAAVQSLSAELSHGAQPQRAARRGTRGASAPGGGLSWARAHRSVVVGRVGHVAQRQRAARRGMRGSSAPGGRLSGALALRLRDAMIHVPILGGMARRTARWLDQSSVR